MGAGIASLLGRLFHLTRDHMRLIAPVGAAAGIGAAFNTPITAVLFVMEEVMSAWERRRDGLDRAFRSFGGGRQPLVPGRRSAVQRSGVRVDELLGVARLCRNRRCRRLAFGFVHAPCRRLARQDIAAAAKGQALAARGRRIVRRPDRHPGAGGSRRRLRVHRQRSARPLHLEVSAAVGRAEDGAVGGLPQRRHPGRHVRAYAVHRRDDRRRPRRPGRHLLAAADELDRRVRPGGHGRLLRRPVPRADDLGLHGVRSGAPTT